MLPVYNLPENAADMTAMRETFNRDMTENLYSVTINVFGNTREEQLEPTIGKGHFAAFTFVIPDLRGAGVR